MTLSSTISKVTYDGDGSTTEFAVSFVFWDADDLRVIHRAAYGTETVWTRGVQYTVTGGAGGTGTLTVKTAPTDHTPGTGERLTIKDRQAETQQDSLPLSGAFPSTVVEQRLDKLTRLIQIHSEEIARSILLPETASLSGLTIPEPGAGELVRYNQAGTALETVRAGDLNLGVDALMTGLATDDMLRWDDVQSAWVNLKTGATGRALLQDATAGDARAELALGTAATKDAGLSAGQVPVMDTTGYPKADGSQISNIWPRGYIDGLILANNATDAANDVDIGAGVAKDDGDSADLRLSSALTKRLDASWAAGTGAGGLDTGVKAADTWYHVWLIGRSDTGGTDILFSASATSPTMPANYDLKRRIGAVLTDGGGGIGEFMQTGDKFIWKNRIADVSEAVPSTDAQIRNLSVPTGLSVKAMVTLSTDGGQTVSQEFILTSTNETDVSPSVDNATLSARPSYRGSAFAIVTTNALAEIRYRVSTSSSTNIRIITQGWMDSRGQHS